MIRKCQSRNESSANFYFAIEIILPKEYLQQYKCIMIYNSKMHILYYLIKKNKIFISLL